MNKAGCSDRIPVTRACRLVIWAVPFVLTTAGCIAGGSAPGGPVELSKVVRASAGSTVQNRSIPIVEFGGGEDVIVFLAAIHGNEPAGAPLLWRLAEHLEANRDLLDNRHVILLPVANPDGFAGNSRHNANGIDLNRNFPAENRRNTDRFGQSALTEPESRAIKALVDRLRPARIVSIHQPLECVDYDGPARWLAEAMAAAGPLEVTKLGSRPGSLGSYAGVELGIPIITLELPREASDLSDGELWRTYGPMLLAAIEYSP